MCFRCGHQRAARRLIWLCMVPGFGPVRGAAQPLIPVCTYPRFQVSVSSRGFRGGRPGYLRSCAPTQVLCVCAPRQPGCLSGGSHPGFQVWAPSPPIWVPAAGLQVRAGAAYPVFTVQGLSGEGPQRWLLWRVL